MANTMLKIPVTLADPLSGTEPPVRGGPEEPWFKETASQTYSVNDLVYLDTNGTIAICTTASTNSVNQLNVPILGMPYVAATGTTGKTVRFQPITSRARYIMNAFHPTAASAVFSQAQLGTLLNVCKSAAGLWAVDVRNTLVYTLPMVQILGFPAAGLDSNGNYVSNAAVGDVNGLAFVRFVPWYEVSGPHYTTALQSEQ